MKSHETAQLYQKSVKHTICISNYQQKQTLHGLDHKTLGKFRPNGTGPEMLKNGLLI